MQCEGQTQGFLYAKQVLKQLALCLFQKAASDPTGLELVSEGPTFGFGESDLDPLPEQAAILTAEPPLQPYPAISPHGL